MDRFHLLATYTVSDGKGGTDIATMTVTVTGTNDVRLSAALTTVWWLKMLPFVPVVLSITVRRRRTVYLRRAASYPRHDQVG